MRTCGAPSEVLSNFRSTVTTCPRCGLKFTFDPRREPLPLAGVRLAPASVFQAPRMPAMVPRIETPAVASTPVAPTAAVAATPAFHPVATCKRSMVKSNVLLFVFMSGGAFAIGMLVRSLLGS
jgi:hypothetical protein